MRGAPVYSLAEEARVRAESATWTRFTAPADSAEFCASWLALLCARIERARAALLLVGEGDQGPYTVAAAWPDPQRDLQYLGPTAQRALVERQGVVVGPDGGAPAPDAPAQVGYPIEVLGRLCAVVVLDIGAGPDGELQRALRQVHWGSAWLIDHFRQRVLAQRERELSRVNLLADLMATALAHARFEPSALAAANELVQRVPCSRASVGFVKNGSVVPLVLSHTASFDAKSDLVRWIGSAMDEALDLGAPVAHPAATADELNALAHAEAARELGVAAMCSVPLVHEGQVVGALSFERQEGPPFDAPTLALLRAAGELLGPAWALQRANERGLTARTAEAVGRGAQALVGPRHPGIKLMALAALLLAALLAYVPADYRVAARTVIEGSVQMAAVAPFDGFVAESYVRAGDTVRKGQPLARLDDRDLKLERSRWSAEREQALRKYQVAQAVQDRATMGVVAAQVRQAEAQLALVEERIARATLAAPFDGVVVSGDLSHLLGTPVEQGKVLFEVAPSEGHRVILQVDERDIARLALGQRGELVLSGLPDEAIPFSVRQMTPVSTAQDGRNFFRVEALVEQPSARLRPGMEGVGKVHVGQASLLWIWTHRFVDWLRLTAWQWLP